METYYLGKKIANFKEVVVTSVSRGSPLVRFSDNTVEEMRLSAMIVYSIAPSAEGVRVTHDVILFIPNDASSEQLYMDDFKSIKEAVYELVNCTGDCPYSVISPPKVNTTETDLRSLCERLLDNPDIAEFYEPVSVEGKIICVTACNSQHSHHKKCYNKGICNVFSSTGPYCECQNVNSTWYLNDDCSLPIQRTAFYAGLSVTLVCLLVTVGALTAYVLINKNKQKQKRDIKEKLVNQWLNEDFEWSRSNSLTGTGNKNPSFTHEETATHREEAGDYRGPVPSLYPDNRQSSPSVSMYSASQTAHRHNMPSSSAGYTQSASPALPHGDLSSTQPMTISRPQIRTSFDA
ncbi:mucin-3A [Micropterus dolomieu]|uniref:mucin-3A n=1 Tax=Micropterus dolomieu TaxID=147949 RepID=UPI001E8CF811|nr:mucin-3A [Micropterus dolomieu]